LGTVADSFTPSDQYWRGCESNDEDLGSGGEFLIPDGTLSTNYPYLGFSADKEGGIWAVNRAGMGTFNQGQCVNSCSNSQCNPANGQQNNQDNQNAQTLWVTNSSGQQGHFHNTGAYWEGAGTYGSIYYGGNGLPMTAYKLCDTPGSPICSGGATSNNDPDATFVGGDTPSVSSNGTASGTGVLWAVEAQNPPLGGNHAVLFAFDAVSMQTLYESSKCATRDAMAPGTKFSVPTIANGYVFVGTQSELNIFGPTTSTCQ
jgi:hypothetical protein